MSNKTLTLTQEEYKLVEESIIQNLNVALLLNKDNANDLDLLLTKLDKIQ